MSIRHKLQKCFIINWVDLSKDDRDIVKNSYDWRFHNDTMLEFASEMDFSIDHEKQLHEWYKEDSPKDVSFEEWIKEEFPLELVVLNLMKENDISYTDIDDVIFNICW